MDDFTAVADCPQCGDVTIHWLEKPRYAPVGDDPVARTQRRIAMLRNTPYDQPESAVIRVCAACNYRWPQY